MNPSNTPRLKPKTNWDKPREEIVQEFLPEPNRNFPKWSEPAGGTKLEKNSEIIQPIQEWDKLWEEFGKSIQFSLV